MEIYTYPLKTNYALIYLSLLEYKKILKLKNINIDKFICQKITQYIIDKENINIPTYAINYNVLRTMSGLRVLSYNN